jgi:hypothetical protein
VTVDLSYVNELQIQISAHCPSCGTYMYYVAFDFDVDIKRVKCLNHDCPEYDKQWDLNMRTGVGRRSSK